MGAALNPGLLDSGSRHVDRLRMRLPDPGLRLRVESSVEDALRVTTLPGEDQGRVYFFQRLRLPEFDLRLPSQRWIACCSQHLLAMSQVAAHVSDGRSATALAVYFADRHEPRRRLLARLLAGDDPQEWYWALATGVGLALPPAIRVEHILEKWHVGPAAWATVARELLPLLDRLTAHTLLNFIRPTTAERWLSGVQSAGGQADLAVIVPSLRSRTRHLIQELRLHFPGSDSRLLFLVALAVLEACPNAPQDAGLIAAAAHCLDEISFEGPAPDRRGRLYRYDHPEPSEAGRLAATIPAEVHEHAPATSPDAWVRQTSTSFAGLFFLLHPLRHLGIAKALDENPQLVFTHFVSRLLLRLAAQAGVPHDDPILDRLLDDVAEQDRRPPDPFLLPTALSHLRRLRPSADLTERVWAVVVRRFCWQGARMTLREIVTRPGRIYATAVDHHITMPMSAVDVRIRRCGFDIDPGYVPWFGRVVHFHYQVEAQP